jgi:hypothetical protein
MLECSTVVNSMGIPLKTTTRNTLAVNLAVRGNEKPQAICLRQSNSPTTTGFLSGVPYGARTRNLMFHRQALCH